MPVARLPHATASENPGLRQLFDAFDSFVEHLAAVEWAAVALALLCHGPEWALGPMAPSCAARDAEVDERSALASRASA